ncbi:MAG TPA: protealysin inhibitor emfourin, partial [Chryseolinea sp.]|nr:protealysin inhibitor emfourin [Chryseolinea sp.]
MIRFKREGGFVGLSKTKEVDEKDLPEHIRKLLDELPEVKVRSGKSVRRDGFKYTVEIEGEKGTRKYTINEEDVTTAIAPLIG